MKITALKLMFVILLSSTSAMAQDRIDTFIMDYPHGEDRIHVKRTGETYLYYGAGALAKVIKHGTFSAEELHSAFKTHLHPNLPREKRPNPTAQYGMVNILYTDGKEERYLIYDLKEFTDKIFDQAKQNIIEDF